MYKLIKDTLYVLRYAYRYSRAEVTLNSEKIKPVAIANIELHLPEGIGQLGSQSVTQPVNLS